MSNISKINNRLETKKRNAFTLVELIAAVTISGLIITGVTAVSFFFIRQVQFNKERYNLWSQISYTFDDMRIRCVSALEATDVPAASGGLSGTYVIDVNSGNSFDFFAEEDVYRIMPETRATNVWYRYAVNENGDLLLLQESLGGDGSFAGARSIVLIDARYNPVLTIRHDPGQEPNFLIAEITASKDVGGRNLTITREEGVRFWFVDPAT